MKTHERAMEEYALDEIKFDGGLSTNGKLFVPCVTKACDITIWSRREFQELLNAIAEGFRSKLVKMAVHDPVDGVIHEGDVSWITAESTVNWDTMGGYGLLGTRIPLLQAIRASSILDLSVLATYERLNLVLFRGRDWFRSPEGNKLQGLKIP